MTSVAFLADVHMRDEHVATIQAGLEAAVEDIASADPAHVFVLGDLIEDGDSAVEDRRNVERVVDGLGAVDAPVTYLLGNHDVARLDRATLAELVGQDAFYGVETVGTTPFVYLDSTAGCAEPPGGALGATQRAWLAETLPELAGAVVLVHHPMGGFDLASNVWFGDFPERAYLGDRLQAFRIVEDATVRGTVSGHIHETQFVRFEGLAHVSVNAFSKERPDTPFTGTIATLELGDPMAVEVRTRGCVTATFTLP